MLIISKRLALKIWLIICSAAFLRAQFNSTGMNYYIFSSFISIYYSFEIIWIKNFKEDCVYIEMMIKIFSTFDIFDKYSPYSTFCVTIMVTWSRPSRLRLMMAWFFFILFLCTIIQSQRPSGHWTSFFLLLCFGRLMSWYFDVIVLTEEWYCETKRRPIHVNLNTLICFEIVLLRSVVTLNAHTYAICIHGLFHPIKYWK